MGPTPRLDYCIVVCVCCCCCSFLLFCFLSTGHKPGSFEKRDPLLRKCFHQIAIFLIDDCGGRAQLPVRGTTPRHVLLGSIKQPASGVSPWPLF